MHNYDKNTDTHHYSGTSASDTEMRHRGIDPSGYWAEANLNMDRHTERLRAENQHQWKGYVSSRRSESAFDYFIELLGSGRCFLGGKALHKGAILKSTFNIIVFTIVLAFAIVFAIPRILEFAVLNIGVILVVLILLFLVFIAGYSLLDWLFWGCEVICPALGR
jgi:hypothetical protein